MAEKMDARLLTVFSKYPTPMDVSDALLFLEDMTGKEHRLSVVFDCIQQMAKDGRLVVIGVKDKRTLYHLPHRALDEATHDR